MAMTRKVWLFGHYDSRGGTTAVEAETRERAVRHYIRTAFAGLEEDVDGLQLHEWADEEIVEANSNASQVGVGDADLDGSWILLGTDDLEIGHGVDLEAPQEEGGLGGRVLPVGPGLLQFFPTGTKQAKEFHSWKGPVDPKPRWYDDAFYFILDRDGSDEDGEDGEDGSD